MTKTYRLAVVAGDGIGPEVVAEGLKCLAAAIAGTDIAFETTEFNLGAARWHATGETLTDEDLAAIKSHDVILLGAIGDPTVPSVRRRSPRRRRWWTMRTACAARGRWSRSGDPRPWLAAS